MKHKKLRFGQGFQVSLGNRRSQAAEMVIPPDDAEGDARNRHRGADRRARLVPRKAQGPAAGAPPSYSKLSHDLFA